MIGNKKIFHIILLNFLVVLLLPSQSNSDDFIEWHTTNIQYLRGWDYELGAEQRTLFTFEHANGWKYGDFHMFVDGTKPDGNGKENLYAEFSPRFSLSKITGSDLSNEFVKDVLISTQLEKVKNTGTRYLYGAGVDLKVPGFKSFKTNFLVRDDSEIDGETWQITLVWNYPFEIKGLKFLIEGFADFAGGEGSKVTNEMVVPRFLLDVGDLAGYKENKFWAGVEVQSWHNKFGVRGKSETVPQLQFKYVF